MEKGIYYIQQISFVCTLIFTILTFCFSMYELGILGLLILGFLIWGLFDLRLHLFLQAICHLSRKHKGKILLSFDDGLNEHTEKVLDILKAAQVQAVFFIIGKTVKQYPHILERICKEGHLVGTHTQNHGIRFTYGSVKYVQKELNESLETIAEITGKHPEWFRPPFGLSNPVIGYVTKQLGLKTLGWSLRSLDTQIKNPEVLKKRLLRKIKANDIILLHDNQEITIQILPDLIEEIRNKGLEFAKKEAIICNDRM